MWNGQEKRAFSRSVDELDVHCMMLLVILCPSLWPEVLSGPFPSALFAQIIILTGPGYPRQSSNIYTTTTQTLRYPPMLPLLLRLLSNNIHPPTATRLVRPRRTPRSLRPLATRNRIHCPRRLNLDRMHRIRYTRRHGEFKTRSRSILPLC